MRRSFGPGMGSGGGGGGGMIKNVHRAIRAGIASPEPPSPYSYSQSTTTRTTTNHQPVNTALSLSSNNLNHPVPASSPPNCSEESDWELCIDDSGNTVNGVYNNDSVFDSVPSKEEVYHAVSSLQDYFHKSGGSDQLDWTEPSLELCNSRSTQLQVPCSSRVYDAFHLMQTEPSVQRMVISLSSDKAVWDAVMNNEVVRELRESIDKSIWEDDHVVVDDGCNPVKQVLRWMFVNTKDKVVEIVERITKIVNEMVQPSKEEKPKISEASGSTSTTPPAAAFQEKLRSSFFLSIMVLLIVVVTRGTRKA
ncbi:hypothetical protein L6452_14630 [Arctium lappa]|uniref:Uncharacterized protein n=1 Tax=Arctium lappa TaxID=4217 RepID=A0ACB9CLH3_ARCLA|nr:hypothetical protein L6452_14630 [Arctium lappa]